MKRKQRIRKWVKKQRGGFIFAALAGLGSAIGAWVSAHSGALALAAATGAIGTASSVATKKILGEGRRRRIILKKKNNLRLRYR